MQNMGMGCRIPVIDMKDFAGLKLLMMEMKVVSRSLLDLTVEVKLRNSDPVEGKGYTSPHKASAVFEGLGT
ncbi:hypothetical protein Acr_18g0007580 [Actinidia rufa]|uniref:Uncharacterized protein n=1 Tax=Actinidia rufa TaxID=165716 RepID=A0A7J0G727_9ERIC|nr:hypothetical protein Acr_18g0007580 [Actinidia rufa]